MAPVQKTVDLGKSLRLTNGDLNINSNDLALVEGTDNFAQAIQVIIGTPFGSDLINVNYGLDIASIYTVPNTARGVKDVIRLNIVKSLAGDDRIQQINAVVFDDDPEFDSLAPEFGGPEAGPTARHVRLWHAVASLTLVSGEQRVLVSGAAP